MIGLVVRVRLTLPFEKWTSEYQAHLITEHFQFRFSNALLSSYFRSGNWKASGINHFIIKIFLWLFYIETKSRLVIPFKNWTGNWMPIAIQKTDIHIWPVFKWLLNTGPFALGHKKPFENWASPVFKWLLYIEDVFNYHCICLGANWKQCFVQVSRD